MSFYIPLLEDQEVECSVQIGNWVTKITVKCQHSFLFKQEPTKYKHADMCTIHCIRFNFCRVKLLQIADYSNFRAFIFVDAGSLICQFVFSSEFLSYWCNQLPRWMFLAAYQVALANRHHFCILESNRLTNADLLPDWSNYHRMKLSWMAVDPQKRESLTPQKLKRIW